MISVAYVSYPQGPCKSPWSVLQPETMSIAAGHAAAGGRLDVSGLSCHLRPYWCLGPCCCQAPILSLYVSMSVACVTSEGHADVCGLYPEGSLISDIHRPCCDWSPYICEWPVMPSGVMVMYMFLLPLRVMSGSEALLQPGPMFMSMIQVTTEAHAEIQGLCGRLKSCLWAMLLPGAILIWLAYCTWSRGDTLVPCCGEPYLVHGPIAPVGCARGKCYGQEQCWGPWLMLPLTVRNKEAIFTMISITNYRCTVEREGRERLLGQPLPPQKVTA